MSIIKSFAIGNGDMFYIKHNSDSFTMIDCCMCDGDEAAIVKELKAESAGKRIVRFISTHPDDDHIRGLVHLDRCMNILNFYCVKNAATKDEECWTDDFGKYCELRDDSKRAFYLYQGCSRKWMNQDGEDRGSAGIQVLWPITDNLDFKDALNQASAGESPNNISPIFTYSLNDGAKIIWMGDLESAFQERIKSALSLPSVDILFAPHHGRDSGKVPCELLEQMSPSLVIIGEAPCDYLDYYSGYNTITQNSAGAITLDCEGDKVHIYVSDDDYAVEFLDDEMNPDAYGGRYIGSLKVKAAKKRIAAGAI